MKIALIIGVVAVVLIAVTAIIIRRRVGRNGPISIVMLRSAPRRLSEADVRGAYRRALGKEPQLQAIPMPDGLTNGYLLISDDLPPLAVIDSTRGYMSAEDARACASRMEHPVARAALVDHTAWVSVDAMGIKPSQIKGEDRAMVYTLLGKVAAELYDDQCLLLYLPADDRVAEPGPDVEKHLRDGTMAELFGDDSLHAPLFRVEKDDEQINSAMAEARRRLPELIAAFEQRGEACHAMFKAAFPTGNDDNEYIWLTLQRVGDNELTGTIENPPIDPAIPPKGSSVSIPIDRVADWAYLDGQDKPIGLFVDRVLLKRGHR